MGGVLYIEEPSLYWHSTLNPYHPMVYTGDNLSRLLRRHGFSLQRLDECPAPPNLLRGALIYLRRYNPYLTAVARKEHREKEDDSAVVSVPAQEMIDRWRCGQTIVRWAHRLARIYAGLLRLLPTSQRRWLRWGKAPPSFD